MRIHDDRYSRERRKFDIALRFIRHEARTHTIHAWTGLSGDRIRKLYRFYIKESGSNQPRGSLPVRHRGKSPRQPAFFTRSARARYEASSFASLCRLTGALPRAGAAISAELRRDPAGLVRGELLCQAYEIYCARFGTPMMTFEHAEFLLRALCRGDELVIGACRDCSAVLVTDRWTVRSPRCIVCAPPAPPAAGLPP
ncbi:MAG: hypothetical protein WB646_15160 [Steroidobacteraceae bacterium]